MKECRVCVNMCEDDAETCPICGAELNVILETEEAPQMKNPVLAASADSPVTAEIFKDMLDENGIAYSVDEKGDIMHVGFGGSYFAVDVYVDEKDLDRATELYKELTENEADFGEFEDFEDFETEEGQ